MRPAAVDPKTTSRAEAFDLWMDGAHAGRFLQRLQESILALRG